MRVRAIVALLGLSVLAAAPGPLSFSTYSVQIETPVEQQPGAVNPTECNWSLDDHHIRTGSGPLPAGYSVSDPLCYIAGTSAPVIAGRVDSKSPNLAMSITVSNYVETVTLTTAPTYNPSRRLYEYRICQQWHHYPFGQLQEIPDSNGGLGIPTDVTFALSNPVSKASAGAQWGVAHASFGGAIGCE